MKDKKIILCKNFYVVGLIKCMISNYYFKVKLMIFVNSYYWEYKRERDILEYIIRIILCVDYFFVFWDINKL